MKKKSISCKSYDRGSLLQKFTLKCYKRIKLCSNILHDRSIPRNDWEIESLAQMLRRQRPEIVTVMLGTNNLLQNPAMSAADCAGRMEWFLRTLLEQTPTCRFLLIAPPPVTLGAWVDDPRIVETSQCLDAHYRAAAQKLGIAFADAGDWDVELAYDGVHFSELGHRAFFVGLGSRLVKLVGGHPARTAPAETDRVS